MSKRYNLFQNILTKIEEKNQEELDKSEKL